MPQPIGQAKHQNSPGAGGRKWKVFSMVPKELRKARIDGGASWFRKYGKVDALQATKTLASRGGHLVYDEFSKFMPNPLNMTALEIGGAYSPISIHFPFKSITLMEADRHLMAQTIGKGFAHRARPQEVKVIVGKIENPKLHGKFGVCIVAEVLTHVFPQLRAAAIRGLAKHADRFFIIDRYASGHHNTYVPSLVNSGDVITALAAEGFRTQIKTIDNLNWTADKYFIITATRENERR
ncbi:Uncharacterised protein [uncultured archaeon]|nr:Uncharacterised protein [uncultured archaeon]